MHGELPQRLGFTIVEAGPERAVARLTVTPALIQGGGVVHGGVLFTLADSAAASLAHALAPAPTTVEATIRFVRPVTGGQVVAVARALHHGRRTLLIEVRLADADGQVAAVHHTTFLVDARA